MTFRDHGIRKRSKMGRPRAGLRVVLTVLALAVALFDTAAIGSLSPPNSSGGWRASTTGDSTGHRSVGPAVSELGSVAASCNFYGTPFGPAGVVYDSVTDEIFVADPITNTVEVISGGAAVLNDSISLGSTCVQPFGLAYAPQLGEVFVTEVGGGMVAVISDSSDSVVRQIPVGGNPWEVAYDSGLNELFVTDLSQNNVTAISLATDMILATIPTDYQPLGIAYSPAGGKVYVADSGGYDSVVSVISDASNSVIARVPVGCSGPPATFGEALFDTLYDPFTSEVYVSCEAENGLGIVSVASDTQVGYVPISQSTTALAFNPTTREVWATELYANQVAAISDTTDRVVAQGPTGDNPFAGIACDTRTGNVYVTDFKAAEVSVLSSSGSPVATIPIPVSIPEPLVSQSTEGLLIITLAIAFSVLLPVAVWSRVRAGPPPPPAQRPDLSPTDSSSAPSSVLPRVPPSLP